MNIARRSARSGSGRLGFTLVELMIVVAIIGILSAIAVPNFKRLVIHSRRAELPAGVDGIKVSETAYASAFDSYRALPIIPRGDGSLDSMSVSWYSEPSWDAVGWSPDGGVRGNYAVDLTTSGSVNGFYVTARSDVDDDGNLAEFTATQSQNGIITPGTENNY